MNPCARRLLRGALPIVALATMLAVGRASASPDALNDGSHDEVKATRVVPDPTRKVGEVRLLARGKAVVVQTVLSTKLLDRVTGEIRRKEEANWPAGDPSRDAYVAALEKVRGIIDKRDPGADWKGRRKNLLIEFAADDANASVFLGSFKASGEDDAVIEREVLETLDLPRSYVLRNMRLILADSFKVAETEVDKIGPLGPASVESMKTEAVMGEGGSTGGPGSSANKPGATAPPPQAPSQER